MSTSTKAGVVQYWPTVLTVALLGVVALKHVSSEPARAVIALSCIGLTLYQWTIFRRKQRLSLPGVILLTLVMVSVWLGLNVIRYHSYPTDSLFILRWYVFVVRLQDLLMWAIIGSILVVTAWSIFRLAHWLAGRVS